MNIMIIVSVMVRGVLVESTVWIRGIRWTIKMIIMILMMLAVDVNQPIINILLSIVTVVIVMM